MYDDYDIEKMDYSNIMQAMTDLAVKMIPVTKHPDAQHQIERMNTDIFRLVRFARRVQSRNIELEQKLKESQSKLKEVNIELSKLKRAKS